MFEARVAVIMSIYKNDKEDYVRLAIESILNQTYRNYDFYIQLDGVVDAKVKTYLAGLKDDRLKIKERSKNMGLAYSLNELLNNIKDGDYCFIARMDADDISVLDRFEKQIAFLEYYSEVDLVGGAINEIDEKGANKGKVIIYPCRPCDCRAFFSRRNPVAHPTVMFRRSFFEKVGWEYPNDYIRNEDTQLWLEGYKHGCVIANISDVLLNFRVTDSFFKNRRNGYTFAKSQLKLRLKIIHELNYGTMSKIYAYAMFLLMISPTWVLKSAYKLLR